MHNLANLELKIFLKRQTDKKDVNDDISRHNRYIIFDILCMVIAGGTLGIGMVRLWLHYPAANTVFDLMVLCCMPVVIGIELYKCSLLDEVNESMSSYRGNSTEYIRLIVSEVRQKLKPIRWLSVCSCTLLVLLITLSMAMEG